MYKPLAWEVSQAETINSATHLWWKAWPAIYSEFRIPLQLSAFCLTNVTVWHEIAPKSSFMVLFGTTYEETRGRHKRMKHSASEKNSGHVCALSGKPLWSCSLSKGHWRMNKLLKHIIPLFRSTPCKPGPCLFFFRGFTHLERLTFATNYFMAFKTDYQKKKFHRTIEYVKLTWWLGTFPQWLGFLLLPSLLSKLKLCFVLLEIQSLSKHNSPFFQVSGFVMHITWYWKSWCQLIFRHLCSKAKKKSSKTFRFTNVVHSSFNRNRVF